MTGLPEEVGEEGVDDNIDGGVIVTDSLPLPLPFLSVSVPLLVD